MDTDTDARRAPDPDSLIEARRDYTADTLRRADLASDPVEQFTAWLADARAKRILDATAMTVATADARGQPHARVVLLKHFDDAGFVWYTYQESDKARQLADNPRAAILFYWCALERQVRIEGGVERLDPADADDYFHSRPEGSRFSAAASVQSAPVADRAVLERRVAELRERHPDGDVPRPPEWGGYRLQPERFEFWQGRADRLHDRFVFERAASGRAASGRAASGRAASGRAVPDRAVPDRAVPGRATSDMAAPEAGAQETRWQAPQRISP